MDTYIQLAFGLSSKIILSTYTYFSYFLSVFTFLFETFPYNILTALTVTIFIVRSIIKKAGSIDFSVQVWKERSNEIEGLTKRIEDMTSKLVAKMEVTRKKVKNAKKAKYDQRIVNDLEKEMKINSEEMKMVQKQCQKVRKYAKQQESELQDHLRLKSQLQALLYCTSKYKEMKEKAGSFYETKVLPMIEPIIFRVYCILI